MKEWMVSEAESGTRSFRYVTRILPGAPVGLLRKSLRKKNITLNGKKMTGQEKLKGGDRICVWFSEDTLQKFMVPKAVEEVKPVVPGFASLIVYEDPKVMILNKPAGLLSQGDGKGASLNDGLLSWLQKDITPAFRPSICNRLDRNTSGLVAAGKTMEALQELNTLIRTRAIRKYYRALVYGKTEEEGTLRGFIKKDSAANTVVWLDHEEEGAYPVETRYRRKEIFLKKGVLYSLVDVELVTGKSHQIRVHFAHMGHPLLGDPKYGSEESKKASALLHIHRQMLHAYRLVFPAITGTLGYLSGKIFEAPLPEEMERLCRTGE